MKRKIKVVIDRSKWRTGMQGCNKTGDGSTQLLNEQGFMCCLGFCMNASKVAKKDLLTKATPSSVIRNHNKEKIKRFLRSNGVRSLSTNLSGGLGYVSSTLASKAMNINDEVDTTPKEKEKKILKLFKDSVFDIEFTGSYHFPETTDVA